jgi:integrase/recombinase XerD
MSDNLKQRNGIWYARVQVRGRDIRRSLRTTSRAEAKKRLEKILKEAEQFRFSGETRHTWKEAVVEWSKAAPESLKPSVIKRYLVSLGQVRQFLDHLYVDEVGRKAMSQIARRPGVTNATRRRDLTAVSAVLEWCVTHGWCEDNVARVWSRRAIKEKRDPIVLPTTTDIDAVVAEAPGNFAKMIRFAQYTGMRQEEIGSLQRSQVNLKRGAVDLHKTKTRRPRSVPLDERAAGTIAGTVPHLKSPYVFWHGTDGSRYQNISSRFAALAKRAVQRAKKEGRAAPRAFRFHDLRHWFAVDYLRRGGSIYDLQLILGHASIKTTEIYLAYLTPEEQQVAKRVGANAGTGITVSGEATA